MKKLKIHVFSYNCQILFLFYVSLLRIQNFPSFPQILCVSRLGSFSFWIFYGKLKSFKHVNLVVSLFCVVAGFGDQSFCLQPCWILVTVRDQCQRLVLVVFQISFRLGYVCWLLMMIQHVLWSWRRCLGPAFMKVFMWIILPRSSIVSLNLLFLMFNTWIRFHLGCVMISVWHIIGHFFCYFSGLASEDMWRCWYSRGGAHLCYDFVMDWSYRFGLIFLGTWMLLLFLSWRFVWICDVWCFPLGHWLV